MDTAKILANLTERFNLQTDTSKVLVVGIGSTGISVAHFLRKLNFQFAITDSRVKPPLLNEFFEMMPDTPVFTGGFDESAFKVATHLVVSPGISLNEKSILQAVARGAKIVSDIDLFACANEKPVIGVTGSNGKSTVTTMLGEMATAAGKRVAIGGNLGIPALDLLNQQAQLYVLELSSFQLERTTALNAAAAVVLNISADHLDRHASMEEYAEQKNRIYKGTGVMVINQDDPRVVAMQKSQRKTLTFSIKTTQADFYITELKGEEYLMQGPTPLMALSALPLEGRHNAANALAALALGASVGLETEAMCKALQRFKGLDHRMQKVAEIRGVTWINDSKATNIGACVAALEGYRDKVILIAGGEAKGADMNELKPIVCEKTKSVVLMGKDAPLIEQALAGCVPVYLASNIKEAVKIAAHLAKTGDSILLSPACASLDQFKNYQDRGNKFVKAVMEFGA